MQRKLPINSVAVHCGNYASWAQNAKQVRRTWRRDNSLTEGRLPSRVSLATGTTAVMTVTRDPHVSCSVNTTISC